MHEPSAGTRAARRVKNFTGLTATVRAVLGSYFGPRWTFALIAALAVAFWPVAVFWEQIKFSPAKFTEEWIKICASGFLVILLLEMFRERAKEEARIQHRAKYLQESIREPSRTTVAAVERLRGTPDDLADLQSELSANWRELRAELKSAPDWFKLPHGFELDRVNALINALTAAHASSELVPSEIEEVHEHLLALTEIGGRS